MKKYLPLYEKWMETGRIPCVVGVETIGGLCSIFHDDKLFKLMEPVPYKAGYWGDDVNYGCDYDTFTPLRQTIVLFLAAMAGELD